MELLPSNAAVSVTQQDSSYVVHIVTYGGSMEGSNTYVYGILKKLGCVS